MRISIFILSVVFLLRFTLKKNVKFGLPGSMQDDKMNDFVDMITLQTPQFLNMALFLYCMNISLVQYRNVRLKNSFHGAVYTALSAFGGGIIVPVLVGHDGYYPFPLANDLALALIITAYILVRYVHSVRSSLSHTWIQGVMVTGFEAARTLMLLNWLKVASKTIPSSYFKVPIVGPILCGTIGGCGGAFLPFEKGLGALKDGAPYTLVSAFLASVFFHFSVNVAPAYAPVYAVSELEAHAICATTMCAVQIYCWILGSNISEWKTGPKRPSWKAKVHEIAWQGLAPFAKGSYHHTPSRLKGHVRGGALETGPSGSGSNRKGRKAL